MLNRRQILKLRPEFKVDGQMTMIDWFEIYEGAGYYTIKSGLRHADGETKSPYYYEHTEGGNNATKKCINHFNDWWNKLNNQTI